MFFAIFDTLFALMFIHCEYKCCISDSIESKHIHIRIPLTFILLGVGI